MKQDRQQELHFEDLAKQFTEDISRSKRIFSMEDAMQDNTMRKSVQKHRQENETENSSGIRNCFFSNRSGTTCFTVVSVPSVFAVPANAGGGAVLLAASGSGRGNASGRRFVCMGTVPCEKIRACRKGVDKHVRILQKEKSTGAGI